eukprot:scaffold11079_cov92-Amphora_coffeaeformis.AAC.3
MAIAHDELGTVGNDHAQILGSARALDQFGLALAGHLHVQHLILQHLLVVWGKPCAEVLGWQ